MSKPNNDIKLTSEEAKQLEQAFQDESFRKLLADYVDEIRDPKHREEQEGEFINDLNINCVINECHLNTFLSSIFQPTSNSWRSKTNCQLERLSLDQPQVLSSSAF